EPGLVLQNDRGLLAADAVGGHAGIGKVEFQGQAERLGVKYPGSVQIVSRQEKIIVVFHSGSAPFHRCSVGKYSRIIARARSRSLYSSGAQFKLCSICSSIVAS